MLYFIYQFLQGIAHNIFTGLHFTGNMFEFIKSFPADIDSLIGDIGFPPLVLAFLGLIFALAFLDKIVHILAEAL